MSRQFWTVAAPSWVYDIGRATQVTLEWSIRVSARYSKERVKTSLSLLFTFLVFIWRLKANWFPLSFPLTCSSFLQVFSCTLWKEKWKNEFLLSVILHWLRDKWSGRCILMHMYGRLGFNIQRTSGHMVCPYFSLFNVWTTVLSPSSLSLFIMPIPIVLTVLSI